eukprot:5468732-Amphidinium_carterae.1
MTPTLVPQLGPESKEERVGDVIQPLAEEIAHEHTEMQVEPPIPITVFSPSGVKRAADVPAEVLADESRDEAGIGAVICERKVGEVMTYYPDEPEGIIEQAGREEDIFKGDIPELDVETAVRKNEEEVQPNQDTMNEDIARERRSQLLMFEEWDAFDLVPPADTKEDKFIDVTWVTEWRGLDGWRCRCVARDYKKLSHRDDLFAATTSSNTARIIDCGAVSRKQPTFTADATKAYLQVPEPEEIYVKPPAEYRSILRERGEREDLCWKMKRMIYGRRTAATRWVQFASDKLKAKGFLCFAGAPYLFHHPGMGVSLELHMDDYYGTCPASSLDWTEETLSSEVKLKRFERHGLNARYTHLKRERVRSPESMCIVPNKKYTAAILSLLEMETCNPVTTPVLPKAQDKEEPDDDEELNGKDAKKYQSCVGVLAYLSQERPDIQFGCRLLATGLSKPTVKRMKMLKRMARYLRGTVDYTLEIKMSDFDCVLNCFGDSDWAGDKSRRSISAGVACWGKVPLFSWARFQTTRALSSGEAEYYQLTTCASEALLLQQALKFLNVPVRIVLYTDSTAALGISKREGVG